MWSVSCRWFWFWLTGDLVEVCGSTSVTGGVSAPTSFPSKLTASSRCRCSLNSTKRSCSSTSQCSFADFMLKFFSNPQRTSNWKKLWVFSHQTSEVWFLCSSRFEDCPHYYCRTSGLSRFVCIVTESKRRRCYPVCLLQGACHCWWKSEGENKTKRSDLCPLKWFKSLLLQLLQSPAGHIWPYFQTLSRLCLCRWSSRGSVRVSRAPGQSFDADWGVTTAGPEREAGSPKPCELVRDAVSCRDQTPTNVFRYKVIC